VRLKEIFKPIRFIEAALLVAAIVTLFGINDRKIPIGLLASSLLLNLTDRVLIAQESNKKDRILQQQEEQLKLIRSEAEEKRSHKTQNSLVQQPTLIDFEKRLAQLESRNEQIIEIQTLFCTLQAVPESLKQIHNRLQQIEPFFGQLDKQYTNQETISKLLEDIKLIRPYVYDLVWDADDSHSVLIEALEKACDRLILVNPWLTEYVFDKDLLTLIEQVLNDPKVNIDIGWGRWADVKGDNTTKIFLNRAEFKKILPYYSALPAIERLEKKYPNQLRLKMLYTHQKYLVCDDKFAMIGSHNFLTSNPKGYSYNPG
jgi:phosphatidylserine/phosphatidylglycerophosphate/cardiolipin synthase-like enzyme